MDNKDSKFKKEIQNYWTKNVPGLEITSRKFKTDEKEFYIDVDNFRYKYDSYVIPLIDSFTKAGSCILEIGCGLGSDSRYMAKKEANVISLDLSWQNVFFTLKGLSLLNLDGNGICADAENLPFKDSTFDVVYSFGVLHHTPNTEKAIEDIYRVLKPNGKCTIMLYHKGYAYYLLLLLHGYKQLLGIYNKEKLMSEYDHTPLSKLYSKKEINLLFRKFKDLNLEITTYGGIQAHPFLKFIYKLFRHNEFLLRNFGSFVIVKCRK
ncbi:MAG: methyltransferase domain-containing protein [Candidatus Omnitrophota bacterium]|nr:methyltransferase domain-containing protein [Candidatus Omnitrophota bacterium]